MKLKKGKSPNGNSKVAKNKFNNKPINKSKSNFKRKDKFARKPRDSLIGTTAPDSRTLNALPNTFKFAAETLKLMSERGGSAGSIVVKKYKSYNYKLIYALVMNTIKNIKIIKKIIHEIKLSKKVNVDDPFLIEILVGDLLFGKGLKTLEQNSTAVSIVAHKDAIIKQQTLLKKEYGAKSGDQDESSTAKYLRINHLKSNIEHVISQLKTLGLKQVEYSKDKIKFKKFINKFKSLEDNEFLLDFHFPNDLIVIKPAGANKLKKSDLIRRGKAMLQDKASFLAVESMQLKPGDKVIDACCAPGGKTTLIGNKLKNKGKIIACDINKERLLSAKHLLKLQGITCAKLEINDFSKLKLRRLLKTNNIDEFDSILIDPSCSGSGIGNRVDYKTTQQEAGRLKKLQAFQVALLKHAIKARISKSIVYCTCSTSAEENEAVIDMALNESGTKSSWNVVEIIPYWPHRGYSRFEFGPKCLRSDYNDLTNGFFVAKLEQTSDSRAQKNDDEDDNENEDSNEKVEINDHGNQTDLSKEVNDDENDQACMDDDEDDFGGDEEENEE